MKIGVLTFYSCDNYGAVLQAYSLTTYLQRLGHDVKLVRHELKSKAIPQFEARKSLLSHIKSVVVGILVARDKRKREESFRQSVSMLLPTVEEYNKNFDRIIVGSDQVWNLNLTQDDLFYLGETFHCEVSSYAASCGHYMALSESQKRLIADNLCRFKYVAVREEETAALMRQATSKNISVVVDPTLLVDNRLFWDIEERADIKGRYVLIYDCMDEAIWRFAKNIANQIHAKVVALSCCVRARKFCKTYQAATVGQFLWLFSHAECVVTTSFHGCAISLSYQKSFYAMNFNSQTTSRMRELLDSVGLLDRYKNPSENGIGFTPIDYTPVSQKLSALREHSLSYLNKVLEK